MRCILNTLTNYELLNGAAIQQIRQENVPQHRTFSTIQKKVLGHKHRIKNKVS